MNETFRHLSERQVKLLPGLFKNRFDVNRQYISNASDSGSIGDKYGPHLCEGNPQPLERLMNDPKSNETIFKQGAIK
jgi:hypothetical protein